MNQNGEGGPPLNEVDKSHIRTEARYLAEHFRLIMSEWNVSRPGGHRTRNNRSQNGEHDEVQRKFDVGR